MGRADPGADGAGVLTLPYATLHKFSAEVAEWQTHRLKIGG